MPAFLQNKAVFVGVVGIIVALVAWYTLSSPSTTSTSAVVTTTSVEAGPGQDLVETLLALRAVKLDGAIFTEPTFMGLVDFSTPIVPEPVGRPNPFAPLNVSISASTSQQAAIFAPQQHGGTPAKQ